MNHAGEKSKAYPWNCILYSTIHQRYEYANKNFQRENIRKSRFDSFKKTSILPPEFFYAEFEKQK